jgi:signal transduction histidine kinase
LERCGDIVSGLLSFSRQSETKYQAVDLNEILDQIIALTSHKMAIQNIRLNKQVCTSPLIINGDVNQLQQCFLNLVFNAMEVMPQGGELGIKSQLDAHGERALVEIRDTGCGIPEEYMGHIFDPFFTTKDKGQGTGMGLAIVYGIVKNHGGNIKADSRVGKGTTFTLDFPIQQNSA